IELSEEARGWLVKHGYDEQMGARPMARVIQEKVKQPLADEGLFGRLKHGGHVRVILKKEEDGSGALAFEYPGGPVLPKPEGEGEDKRAPKAKKGGAPTGPQPPPKPKPLVKV